MMRHPIRIPGHEHCPPLSAAHSAPGHLLAPQQTLRLMITVALPRCKSIFRRKGPFRRARLGNHFSGGGAQGRTSAILDTWFPPSRASHEYLGLLKPLVNPQGDLRMSRNILLSTLSILHYLCQSVRMRQLTGCTVFV